MLHYCERLATHDTALRAAGTARAQIYHRLAHGPAAAAVRLHSGELVARVGADVDELADVLVRAVVPIGVAAVLALAATVAVAVISPPAAAVLAICLLIAGVVAPWLAGRGPRPAGRGCPPASFRARHVGDDRAGARARASRRRSRCPTSSPNRNAANAIGVTPLDAAARPAAIAEAVPTAAIGASVLGAVVAGIGLAPAVAPTTLAILMLLPLSAFEAMTPLPAAAVQLTRSRIAARRLLDLAPTGRPAQPPQRRQRHRHWRRPGCRPTSAPATPTARSHRVTLDLPPGARLAVTGASGSG